MLILFILFNITQYSTKIINILFNVNIVFYFSFILIMRF